MNIECGAEVLNELESGFRFNDAVLRHLIVKRDEADTEHVLHHEEQGREGRSPPPRRRSDSASAATMRRAAPRTRRRVRRAKLPSPPQRARRVVDLSNPEITMSKFFRRKKFCRFTAEGVDEIDYKDLNTLRQYITETGKIVPSRITGHQGALPAPVADGDPARAFPGAAAVQRQSLKNAVVSVARDDHSSTHPALGERSSEGRCRVSRVRDVRTRPHHLTAHGDGAEGLHLSIRTATAASAYTCRR